MKLYIANAAFYGTQAEARKVDRGFTPVEVPTDKPGLIEYLNARSPALPPPAEGVSAVVAPPAAAERHFSADNVLARMDAAAAPDMFAALEGLLKQHNGGALGLKGQCCAEADAAIDALAKARGQ